MVELARPELDFRAQWTDDVRKVLSGGRFVARGAKATDDGGMWLYRSVPLAPVVDARDPSQMIDASVPLLNLYDKLGVLASTTAGRRAMNKGSYREVHHLLVNTPDAYRPPDGSPIGGVLLDSYGRTEVQRRLLATGVRLVPKITRKGESPIKSAIRSVAFSLAQSGIPLDDFESDYEVIDKIMRDSGLQELGRDIYGRSESNLARFWWNFGRSSDIPFLVHSDHIHFFATNEAAQKAAIAQARDLERGRFVECDDNWGISGAYALTFATVSGLDLPWVDYTNPVSHWAVSLLDHGARAVSIRTRVEPAKVTRGELRRKRDTYKADIAERSAQTGKEDAQQVEKMHELEEIERSYATGEGSPTLYDTSIVVAFDGIVKDVHRHLGAAGDNIEMSSGLNRQRALMSEMSIASPVRATPHLHDLPSQSVALSGIVNLSTVGDKDGALLGFTEYDRQPAYFSSIAASAGDAPPFAVILGQTGSGKTMALLSLARQWIRWPTARGEMTPVVLVDPKAGQDFSKPVRALGGQVFSLDDMTGADGALDPIRVMADKSEAVQIASAMLSSLDVWAGKDDRRAFEVPVLRALRYGVENGASCVIEALRIADAANPLPAGLIQPIVDLVGSDPMARAIIGVNPGGTPLRQMQGLTLIRAGKTSIPLPAANTPWDSTPVSQKVGTWVLRMMVYGSASAVSYREGVVILDEAWQFMIGPSGASEIQRLSRLARSMQFLMVLASQRVSDFIDADLTGGISRGLILPMERGTGVKDKQGNIDDGQAGLALDLFQIGRTEKLLSRLSAKATLEGSDQPNWASMRALKDPETGKVIRGSIGLYIDLSGRVVPTEVSIPPDFLKAISTTATDVIAREQAERGF